MTLRNLMPLLSIPLPIGFALWASLQIDATCSQPNGRPALATYNMPCGPSTLSSRIVHPAVAGAGHVYVVGVLQQL